MLISFKLQLGKVPYFVGGYLSQAVASPWGEEGSCYLGVARSGKTEHIPDEVELLTADEFVVRFRSAMIFSTNAENTKGESLTDEEKDAISEAFIEKNSPLTELSAELRDRQTGKKIREAVHRYCGADAERAILRKQIARMLGGENTASAEFLRLDSIATSLTKDEREI